MQFKSFHRPVGTVWIVILMTGLTASLMMAAGEKSDDDTKSARSESSADAPATSPKDLAATEPADSDPKNLPGDGPKPAEKPLDPVTLRNWFNDLGHRDAAVREEARVHLMNMGRRNLDAFQKIVEENRPLAPSQANALRQIVNNVYLSGDSYDTSGTGGFLGIRMQQVTVGTDDSDQLPHGIHQSVGVVIVDRMAGFCGARNLLDGDVVLNIAEHPVKVLDPNAFVNIISQEMRAGQTIHFELLRQGQVIRVPVTLDPRPEAAEPQNSIQEFLNQRATRFETFWNAMFKPIVEEGVG